MDAIIAGQQSPPTRIRKPSTTAQMRLSYQHLAPKLDPMTTSVLTRYWKSLSCQQEVGINRFVPDS